MKRCFVLLLIPVFFMSAGFSLEIEDRNCEETDAEPISINTEEPKKDFIKWIDFNAKKDVIVAAQKKHKDFVANGVTDVGTCELLAYVAVKNGNEFSISKDVSRLKKVTADGVRERFGNKYFDYYREGYHAILDGIIDSASGETIGYFPLAEGFWYTHADDFGNARGYGYKRRHLGNDVFGGTGTPIIAVEGGAVTELGWNRYGGWRVGIRSDDTKRYYYYAHLRKGRPFAMDLKLGDRIEAGQVIGYLGATGYSRKEDTNMDSRPHLHFGMQIIFDQSQEDGITELWIDVFEINRFLARNKAEVIKDPVTKEYFSVAGRKKGFPKWFI